MKFYQKISILFIAFALNSCGENKSEEQKVSSEKLSLTEQQIKFNGIEFGNLEEREFAPLIHAYGKVEVPPQNKTLITAKFGGFVKSIEIIDGMVVKKGQKLIEIEDPNIIQMQQDYLENESSLDYLKAEFERQEILMKDEASSLKNYQLAKSNYKSAKAKSLGLKSKLKLAGVDLANLNENSLQQIVVLKAPFDGIITKVNVQTGSYINPQDQLMELIDTKHAHAEVSVYEKDIYKLAKEQAVTMLFPNLQDKIYGKIYMIGHDIDKDKTVKVHCHFNDEQIHLIPGTFFKATIKTKSHSYLSLPNEAVIQNKGKSYVFVLKEKRKSSSNFEAVEVTIIAENDSFTAFKFENLNQLKNRQFVVKGAYDLYGKMMEE